MLDQPPEVPGVPVYAVDRLLVLVVQQRQVGPEEVACQEGQHLPSLEHPEEQVEVKHLFLLGLLEEPVENTGGLGLHKFDGLLWEFELPLVGVGGQGRDCDVGDGLGYECGGVRDIIEQFGVVGFNLLRELLQAQQLLQRGFGLEQAVDLFCGFTVPGHLFRNVLYIHSKITKTLNTLSLTLSSKTRQILIFTAGPFIIHHHFLFYGSEVNNLLRML